MMKLKVHPRADAVDAVSVASNAPCKSPAMQSSLSSSALRGGDLDFSLRAGKVEFAYRFPRLSMPSYLWGRSLSRLDYLEPR